ncbi:T9SS type A sorting domain-containing protein [uncultured Kordia sp.]|uniref:T9SS type A sorting domain-containing protein n=1 Tax=uncultured Kordia sp. TaxID=507699 RepID=UPI002631D79D|nr:T9SS type A sorting domain-containing protein [uncultured Kordia sp.]
MKNSYFLTIVFAIFSVQFSSAQVTFEDEVVMDNTMRPARMTSFLPMDFDNDGDVDLLFASEDNSNIVWFENIDGNINHSEQKVLVTTSNTPLVLRIADIDNDGDNDIICRVLGGNSKIVWFENLGDNESFNAPQTILTGINGLFQFYIGDVDNDGDLDIISNSRQYDNSIYWLENIDGQANFGARQIITTNTYDSTIHPVDIDNDGDLDVLSITNSFLLLYENLDGQGSFSNYEIISNEIEDGSFVKTADLDNDGDLDIISSSKDDKKIGLFEHLDGQGNFGAQQTIAITEEINADLSIADMDGDGDLDILSVEWIQNRITWYENTDGQGDFSLAQFVNTDNTSGMAIAAVDFDNDNDLDILAASSTDDSVAWYENTDGQGGFGSQNILIAGTRSIGAIQVADLDNDNDLEILFVSSWSDKVAWYENLDNQGGFANQKIITTYADNAEALKIADIDGDGDMDAISASRFDNKIAWYENLDGQGNFGPEQVISTTVNQVFFLDVGDIDGDGDIDIVTVSNSMGTGTLMWFKNLDGQGNFSSEQIIPTNSTSYILHVGLNDVDNDGDIDLMASMSQANRVFLFKNTDGLGTFASSEVATHTTELRPNNTHMGDIDGDGDKDLVVSVSSANRIVSYKNIDGQGTFSERQIVTTSTNQPGQVHTADVDNDGDMDIISSSFLDSKIAWYENLDGLGDFGPQQIISQNVLNVNSMCVVDFDSDGDMDILSTSAESGKITWHRNDLINPLSIDEFNNSTNAIKVFPNPVVNELFFETNKNIEKITVYNLSGKMVKQFTAESQSLDKIQMKGLSKGLYFVKIQTANGTQTQKVIKL